MNYKTYIVSFFMTLCVFGYVPEIHAQISSPTQFTPTQSTGVNSQPVAVTNIQNKSFAQFVADFVLRISDYVIRLLVALSVFVFLFGVMKYVFKGQGSDTARTEGQKLMLWGIIGLFSITAVWGLVSIFASMIGHTNIVTPQFRR